MQARRCAVTSARSDNRCGSQCHASGATLTFACFHATFSRIVLVVIHARLLTIACQSQWQKHRPWLSYVQLDPGGPVAPTFSNFSLHVACNCYSSFPLPEPGLLCGLVVTRFSKLLGRCHCSSFGSCCFASVSNHTNPMASTLGPELTSDPTFEVLSPWDRELVCRLKQTYPADVLSELFSDTPTRTTVHPT